MIRRLLFTVAVGLLAVAVPSAQAFATIPGVTATIQVTSASQIGGCVAGLANWDIKADVTVENNSGGPITLASAAYHAHADGNLALLTVNVDLDGGLPGTTILNGNAGVFPVDLTAVAIPCTTVNAEVCVVVSVLDPLADLDESCDPFISGGTPIPVGAVGLVGLAGLLGAVFLLVQRRRTREAVRT